jgi:hypothetical protein
MANVYTTLADLVKINDQNLADYEISDLLDAAPLLKALHSQTASNGTEHKYLKQTGAPAVGFRDANDGRENKASADTLVTVTLKILDASFACDKSLADAFRKGRDAYIQREAIRHLRAAFQEAEQQILYGTGNDSLGFAGLANNAAFDKKDDTQVVDAGGTTANTASSAWLFYTAEDAASTVIGEDGELKIGDTVVQRVAGATTGFYPAYWTPVTAWMGFQLGGAYDIVRICNLTADSGKGLTDALISSAIAKFMASRKPNLIACSRRSVMQLQKSRTATNPTGDPAPIPEESFKIPIVVTDQISDTEALLAAS